MIRQGAVQAAACAEARQPAQMARNCACGNRIAAGAECAECAKQGCLQRKAYGSFPSTKVPSIVHEVLRSPGSPLDRAARNYFEPRFGHDFSSVRVHTDAAAAESARAVYAQAYTVGRNIVFDRGRFDPGSADGRRLLAHELTHVVQQAGASPSAPQLSLDDGGDIEERVAEEQAVRLTQGAECAAIAPGQARVARLPAQESRAQVDQRVLKKLIEIVRRYPKDGQEREQPLRDLMTSVPKEHARGLYSRLEPGEKTDDFAQYLKDKFPTTRMLALDLLKGTDSGPKSSATPDKSAAAPRALLADPKLNPRYIDNAFKSGGIPWLGGPVCFTEEETFSAFRKNTCIARDHIHYASDPIEGKTLFEVYKVYSSEKEALEAVDSWERESPSSDIKVVGYYVGADGYIFPTVISMSTAPGVTGASGRGIKEEAVYAAAASKTLWEAFLTFAGLRFPIKATSGSAVEPLAGAAAKAVASVEQALGAEKYAELLRAVTAIRQVNPEFAALTVDEMVAIRAYTGEAWSGINAAARGFAKSTPESDALIKAMASGLKKLPAFTGRLVRTEGRMVKEAQAVFREGATVVMDGFTSTSRAGAVAQREGNVAMTIEAIGKNGRDITKLSVHMGKEAEVLFPPGTKFLVQKMFASQDALVVMLKEL